MEKAMNCFNESNADLLIGYFENTLPEADRRAVDAHAAECAECRRMLGLHTMLDEVRAPEVSPNFDARLYARINADHAQAWWARPWWHLSNLKLAIPVTAVAAMLAVGVFMFDRQKPVVVDDGTKTATNEIQQLDVQQLEQALDDLELLMPLSGDAI